MADLFISYARTDDEPFVEQLYRDLIQTGVEVWWDRKIMPNRGRTFLQELRDGIEASERVLAVLGPRALDSEYVQAEWEHARLFAKGVVFAIRIGSFEQIPKPFGEYHAIDFSDDKKYAARLEELRGILATPVAPLAAFRTSVPALPPRFQMRSEVLQSLTATLLADVHRPTVIRSSGQTAVLQGMGGAGKSVVAAAFARTIDTRRAFSDGIVWVPMGVHGTPLAAMRALGRAFGDDPNHYLDPQASSDALPRLLESLVCLIVLDDVWEICQATPIVNALGPRCRLLITTRQRGIATSLLGSHELALSILSKAAALRFLSNWCDKAPGEMPSEASEVAQQCGYLPFALALCGAMVRSGTSWVDINTALHKARIDFPRHQFLNYEDYPDLLNCIRVSIDHLEQHNPTAARLYHWLAVFPPDERIPEQAVIHLWSQEKKLEDFERRRVLVELDNQALIQIEGAEPERRIALHDVLHDYLRMTCTDLRERQQKIIDLYRQKGNGRWETVPDDGYFLGHLAYHLREAGLATELYRLIGREWMEMRFARLGTHGGFLADIEMAIEMARNEASNAIELVKLYAAKQVIGERLGWITDTDLRTLVWLGRGTQALGQARLRPDSRTRYWSLIAIYDEFISKSEPKPELLDEAESVAQSIAEGAARADALREIGTRRLATADPRWSQTLEEALRAANSAEESPTRWKALLGLAEAWRDLDNVKCREILDASRAVVEQTTEYFHRSEALRDISLAYARMGQAEDALQTLKMHSSSGLAEAVTDMLLAAHKSGDFSRILTDRALALVKQNKYSGEDASELLACIHALNGDRAAFDAVLGSWNEQYKPTADWRSRKPRRCLIRTLVAGRDFESASLELQKIKDRENIADALDDIVQAAQDTEYRGIDQIVSMVASWFWPQTRGEYLSEDQIVYSIRAGRYLFRVGKAKDGLELIRWLHDKNRADALNALLPELDRMEGKDRIPLLEEAAQITREIKSNHGRESVLRTLALAFAKAQDERGDTLLNQAWSVARSNAATHQPEDVLLDVAETFVVYGSVESCRKVLAGLHSIPKRANALCRLARLLFEHGNAHYSEVLTEVLETIQTIDYCRDRMRSLLVLIDLLGHTKDPKCRSFIEEAKTLACYVDFEYDPYLLRSSELDMPGRLEALPLLIERLTELKHFDEALELAETIPHYPDIRGQRLAHIAMNLGKIGDPRSNKLFEEAKDALKARPVTENVLVLMSALAGVERFDEAVEIAQTEYLTADNGNKFNKFLAAFTQTLIHAGRLEDAWTIAHSIVLPAQRATALINLALALNRRGDAKSHNLLDEVCQLAETIKNPDRRAYVISELTRGLAWTGELERAELIAETISFSDFRADAFREMANSVQDTNPELAEKLIRRAVIYARSILDTRQRKFMMATLVDSVARTQGVQRAFELLEVDSIDDYIGTLVRWAAPLEKLEGGLPIKALRAAIAIAAWVRFDWKDIHDRLES